MVESACILDVTYDKNNKPRIIKICFFNESGEEVTTIRVKADMIDIENPQKGMPLQLIKKEK